MFQYQRPADLRARYGKPALSQLHSETSNAAARAVEPRRGRLQLVVLDALKNASSGLTDEEIQEATGMNPSTERPRRIELVEAGRVVDSRLTRKTKSGRQATIWRAA